MSEKPVLGIDISKDKLDVDLLVNGKHMHNVFDNQAQGHQQLVQWVKKQGLATVHACMEATGKYGEAIAEYLYAQGFSVSVVNPARIKAYGQSQLRRNKTDKADAQLIAEFCLSQNPALWSPPSDSFKDLQAMMRRLEDLQNNRQQESNRLQSGLSNSVVIDDLNAHLEYLDKQITKLRQSIQQHIDRHPDLKQQQELLESIPGIGSLTAAKLLSEIRNVSDFDSARQLAAYAGLTPKNFRSGTSVHRKTVLSKTGNANIRKMLYMSAISAKRWNPIIRSFCERLALSGLRPMEIIGAAMRKLSHLVFGILKSKHPFDPNHLANLHLAA